MSTNKSISRVLSVLLSIAMLLAVLIGSAAFPTSARASGVTITVNSNLDNVISGNGLCTLREAITNANTNAATFPECAHGSGSGTIVFSDALGTATITLGSELPDITDFGGLTINGGGDISVSGNNTYRVFVNSGTGLTLDSLWVKNGKATASNGAGIYNDGGALTITNSTVTGNSADHSGGAIYNYGTLTITNSLFYNNFAGDFGGGVHNLGPMTITNSIFTTNSAGVVGGGVNNNGVLTITKSTFYANHTGFDGGGVYNYDGNTLTIANSTFTLNAADESGGGVYNYSNGTTTITNSTFSANTSANGAGIFNHSGGTVNLYNTILANSLGSGDCVNSSGTVTGSNNFIEATGNNACGLANGINGNITGSDPNLGALVGSPAYFRLNSGSPAIDAGSDAKCAAAPVNNAAQNGVTRPFGAHCDIGSIESGATFVVNVTADTDDGFCEPFIISSTNCTLREAINAANVHNGADTIHFDNALGTATITLGSSLPVISDTAGLTIDGGDDITVSGNNLYRVFVINPSVPLTLDSLTVQQGKSVSGVGGGAFNAGGTLTITNCLFSANSSIGSLGGGVANLGTAIITDSIFSGNTATYDGVVGGRGGGVYLATGSTTTITRTIFSGNSASMRGGGLYTFGGTLTITDSTFSNNTTTIANDGGGGIYNDQGMLTITHSSFSNNHANSSSSNGGAIFNSQGTLTITRSTFSGNSVTTGAGGAIASNGTLTVANSTFTNNSASLVGGGVYNGVGGVMTSTNNTFSGNSTGGGIANEATLNLYNTILANTINGIDCVSLGSGTVSGSNNLIEATGSSACGLTNGTNGNIIGSDPNLGAATLLNPVYFPLNAGSLALNAGNDTKCAAAPVSNTSQNGVPRPQAAHCEIGSYEQNVATTITISGNVGVAGAVLNYTGGTTTSAADGSYSFTVPFNWSGTVTPTKACYTFIPTSHAYSNVVASQTAQNFTFTLDPGSGCANVNVLIGGGSVGNYFIPPHSGIRVNYAGVDNGPLKVVSTNGIPLIAALRDAWVAPGGTVTTSFAQLMGLPATQLSNTYLFPAYNNVTLNEQLRIGNVDTVDSNVTVTIGGVLRGTYLLHPGGAARVNYAGLDSGPVVVQGTLGVNIIAAMRDAWVPPGATATTSFVQFMGLPTTQLSDTYVFPAYNNVTLNEQLRIGNVDTVDSNVTVTIGGVLRGTYLLHPGEAVRMNYAGLDSGPVVVKGTSGVDIITALRDAWTPPGGTAATSFSQFMGLPATQLSASYLFPTYNNVTLDEQLRIGNVDTVDSTVTVTIGGVLRGTYLLHPGGAARVNYAGLDSGPVVVQGTTGVDIIAALRDAWAPPGGTTISFVQLMGLPATQLSTTYVFPAYNNITLDGQLRIGAP